MDNVTTRMAITVTVKDRLGVLAQIAQVFADHGVSISTMHQTEDPKDQAISVLRLVTHTGRHRDLMDTVGALRELPVVAEVLSVIPVETGD